MSVFILSELLPSLPHDGIFSINSTVGDNSSATLSLTMQVTWRWLDQQSGKQHEKRCQN